MMEIQRAAGAPRRGRPSSTPAAALLVLVAGVLAGCGDVNVAEDPGADTSAGGAVTTAEYCTAVTQACGTSGANAQYSSASACATQIDVGAGLPAGTRGESSGNSLACRLFYALLAQQGDPGTQCPRAGPTGGNQCGSWCDNYCHLAMRNCRGGNALFDSATQCLTDCARVLEVAGDEAIRCRITLVGAAGIDPATAAPEGCRQGALGADACL